MSTKNSQNPMQYNVKSASGTVNRFFRKRESAEDFYKKSVAQNPDEVIVLEDVIAHTILHHHTNSEAVVSETSGQVTTIGDKLKKMPEHKTKTNIPKNILFEYKDGHLIRKETNGKSRKTVIGKFKSLFSKKEK